MRNFGKAKNTDYQPKIPVRFCTLFRTGLFSRKEDFSGFRCRGNFSGLALFLRGGLFRLPAAGGSKKPRFPGGRRGGGVRCGWPAR